MPRTQAKRAPASKSQDDVLFVHSVEKAFRIIEAFDEANPTLALSQIVTLTGLDKSAAQRFSHTLCKLGILRKDPDSKRLELTAKTLDLGYRFTRTNAFVKRALPYLLHLSKATEETVNLTILDENDIVFVARFLSRHVLNTDVTIGKRMPAYCTAPGRAILAALPRDSAVEILKRSSLRAYTPRTIYRMPAIMTELDATAARGYATAFEEVFAGDASVAAAIVDSTGRVLGAVNLATSTARFSHKDFVTRFSGLVTAAARSISQT